MSTRIAISVATVVEVTWVPAFAGTTSVASASFQQDRHSRQAQR
jgi:hypothetical protein